MVLEKHNKSALIMGAHELVGRKCLIRLLKHEAYSKVTLLLEEPLNFSHSKLDVQVINFEHLDRYQEQFKVNDIFYCWGGQMRLKFDPGKYKAENTYAYQLAKLAQAVGTQQFFYLSSIAADESNQLYYRRQKWELENQLGQIPFWAIHIFRPSILIEAEKGSTGTRLVNNLSNRINKLSGGKLDKYKPISGDKVAAAMIFQAQQFKAGVHIYSPEFLHEFSNNPEEGQKK